MENAAEFDDFKFLRQGYYCLGDDVPACESDPEEEILCAYFGEYYTEGEYLAEGFTREDLLDWAYYDGGYYGCGYGCGYDLSGVSYAVDSNIGNEPAEHSISKKIDIKRQQGPKCSAYASAHLFQFYGVQAKPKQLYKRFHKLPDGSAIPSSVAKVTGFKMHRNGSVADIERSIDADKPVMILGYYDDEPSWDNLHYMLVTGYDAENIYIADSLHTSGERYYNRKIKREDFEEMWDTSETLLIKIFYGKNIYYEYSEV